VWLASSSCTSVRVSSRLKSYLDSRLPNPWKTRPLFDCQPVGCPLICGARYADTAIAPLVNAFGATQDEDASLPFRHPRDSLPGKAGQLSDVGHSVRELSIFPGSVVKGLVSISRIPAPSIASHFFFRGGGGGGAFGGTYPSVVRLLFGPGLDGAFGMASLISSVAAVAAVVLWVAGIPLLEDFLTVPVADSVVYSYSPHCFGGGGACGGVDETD